MFSARNSVYSGVPVLHLSGELDVASLPDIKRQMSALAPATCLIIDLEGVTFMDSSFVGQLVRLHDDLTSNAGAVALASCPTNVARVLHMLGIQAQVAFFDDVDAAAEYLKVECSI
ncbi:MAG TPA: STAS domain-containing protein [Coriobacteriia bacterium]|nr:STAS domain-containing protein [Coriobacteriia bacterium]